MSTMSVIPMLPQRQTSQEEIIAQKIKNLASQLARQCESRMLDGLPMEMKLLTVNDLEEEIRNLIQVWTS